MALLINTGLTTSDGGTVASGAFVKFDTYFPMDGLTYGCNLSIWRSEAAKDSGLNTVKPIEIPNLNFQKTMTEQEYLDLTPVTIHNNIKAYLEGFVGVDNVEVQIS